MFKSRLPEHVPGPFDPEDPQPVQWSFSVRHFVVSGTFGVVQAIWLLLLTIYFLFLIFPVLQQTLLPSTSHTDVYALVRWLHSNEGISSLAHNVREEGRFTKEELDHYADVRVYLLWTKLLILPATFAWGFLALSVYHYTPIRLARLQILFIRTWVFLLIILTVWGMFYWDSLFALLHQPFFGTSSWRFSEESYSLRLFPEWLWRIIGVMGALLPLFLATILHYLCSRQKADNGYFHRNSF